ALTYPFLGPGLLLLPLALVVLLLFTAAVITWTSAWNVRYRDITYIVELAMLAWFWGTPIVYPTNILPDRIRDTAFFDVYLLNPLANIVLGFQRALYGGTDVPRLPTGELVLPAADISWYALRLGVVGLVSLVLLYLAWRTFFRLSGDFAEEL
ncbi:MAG TPA: ABC transporter permease, partial [Actinomycetota bacterium]|nr:ABC transporter permease [Actinomycetota bacterium]